MTSITSVLQVVSSIEPSGPINVIKNLAGANTNSRVKYRVLALSDSDSKLAHKEFNQMGVATDSLGLSRKNTVLPGIVRFRKEVARINPDVIHTHGIRADLLSALSYSEKPRVATVHNVPHDDYPLEYGTISGSALSKAHIGILRNLPAAACCSYAVSNELSMPSLTIQNGVDTKKWSPAGNDRKETIRKDLGISDSDHLFVLTGPLKNRKQPLKVISAFLNSDLPKDHTIVVLGSGPLYDECKEISNNHKSVIVTGFVDSISPYLNAADSYISASIAEGLPLGVLEALSSGLPVCLSGIPAHSEIFDINDDIGIRFDAGSERDIRQSLAQFKLLDHDVASRAAREVCTRRLNAKRMAREYEALYRIL